MPIVRYDYICFWVHGDRMITDTIASRIQKKRRFECFPQQTYIYGNVGEYTC